MLYTSSVEGARVKIWEGWEFFGHSRTSNEAEYLALIFGVMEVVRKFLGYGVHIEGDSALVVNQIRGTFRAQSSLVAPLRAAALRLLDQIGSYEILWGDRSLNSDADALTNRAVDTHVCLIWSLRARL